MSEEIKNEENGVIQKSEGKKKSSQPRRPRKKKPVESTEKTAEQKATSAPKDAVAEASKSEAKSEQKKKNTRKRKPAKKAAEPKTLEETDSIPVEVNAPAPEVETVVAEVVAVEEVPVVEETEQVVEVPVVEETEQVEEVPVVEEKQVEEVPAVEEAAQVIEVPVAEEAEPVVEVSVAEVTEQVEEVPAPEEAEQVEEVPTVEEVELGTEAEPVMEDADPSAEEQSLEEIDYRSIAEQQYQMILELQERMKSYEMELGELTSKLERAQREMDYRSTIICKKESQITTMKEENARLEEELSKANQVIREENDRKEAERLAKLAAAKDIVLINVDQSQVMESRHRVRCYAAFEVKRFLEEHPVYDYIYVVRKGLQVSQLRKLNQLKGVKLCDDMDVVNGYLKEQEKEDGFEA